jgi:hypothetical protein
MKLARPLAVLALAPLAHAQSPTPYCTAGTSTNGCVPTISAVVLLREPGGSRRIHSHAGGATMRMLLVCALMLCAGCVSAQELRSAQSDRDRLASALNHCNDLSNQLTIQNGNLVRQLGEATRTANETLRDWNALKAADAGASLVDQLRNELRARETAVAALTASLDEKTALVAKLQSDLVESNTRRERLEAENSKLATEVNRLTPAEPLAKVIGKVYSNPGGGHWVKEKANGGRLIILEDGSLWEINSVDRIETMLWLPTESIFVREIEGVVGGYSLINTDSGDEVRAIYLGK